MTQLFSNNVSGVLASGINNVATSLTLIDASGMPSPTGGDYFLLTFVGLNTNGVENSWEIMKCTARSGNVLTVVRGQEGTTAVSWATASSCQLRLTAGSMSSKADTAAKDVSGGYVGKTLEKINIWNTARTFLSFFTTAATAARTWAFPDKDGTVAMTSDITGGISAGSFTTLAASGNVTLGDAEATDTHAVKGATTVLANSASPALKVTQTGAGNAFVVEDSASTDSTPFVIDANGRVVLGTATVITVGSGSGWQLNNHGTSTTGVVNVRWSNDATGPSAVFAKSKSSTVGVFSSVVAGDTLGGIRFFGDDGSNLNSEAAQISAVVDGTPGTNDMPGCLVFSTTADGARSPTERMRIDSAGLITVTGNLTTTGNATLGDATTDTLNVGNGGIIKDASNNVGFGASPGAGQRFRVGGTLTGNINAYAQRNVVSVASDVTSNALGYDSTISTDATSFTLTNLSHYYANQGTFGVGSAVTSQYGFRVASNMVGAANNYGFYGAIEAGSGRYNFYASGTAQNVFMGETSFGVVAGGGGASGHLRIGYNVTGATSSVAVLATPSIQSDVTTTAVAFQTQVSTQDTAFTLSNLYHYQSVQGTITGGSRTAPTTQVGFQVNSSLTGATNNYGFRGEIASGSNRYNFYASGTAQNSFSGDVLIHGAGGMGYTTGSGGTVTQATSKGTAVTLNKHTGQITTHNAALAADTTASFLVNNSLVTTSDSVVLATKAGGVSGANYNYWVAAIVAGGFYVSLKNISAGSLSEAVTINFSVIKGSTT